MPSGATSLTSSTQACYQHLLLHHILGGWDLFTALEQYGHPPAFFIPLTYATISITSRPCFLNASCIRHEA